MNTLVATLKLLGNNFYLSPNEDNQSIREALPLLKDWINWPDPEQIQSWLNEMDAFTFEELKYPFSVLFEGQGQMECPPWGSVYLDENNLVFGDSTLEYVGFLNKNNLKPSLQMKEPEDQFGLMLLALSQLLEQENHQASIELLNKHLLPWSKRYLELLSSNKECVFYANLAQITQILLNELIEEFSLTIDNKKLYL